MKKIKVKTPAKINLTLEVLNRRADGFHNIQSIMQAISLYDYLTFDVSSASGIDIVLNGSSPDIPYNSFNLVYKAAERFFEKAGINNVKLNIYIEKTLQINMFQFQQKITEQLNLPSPQILIPTNVTEK